ncbi:hypothetical protein D3C86_1860430 [compost metagenome]
MKKISLKNLNLKDVEQLSREQLKNVLGGFTGSGGSGGSEGSEVGSEVLEVTCATSCRGWDSQRFLYVNGVCTKATVSGGLQICICSVPGGDCYL